MTRWAVLLRCVMVGMVLVIASSASAQTGDTHKPLRMTLTLVGGVGDTASTLYAVGRGGREMNPFMRSLVNRPPVLLVTQVGVSVWVAKMSDALAARGRKKTAMAVAAGYLALKLAVTARNVRVGLREGR